MKLNKKSTEKELLGVTEKQLFQMHLKSKIAGLNFQRQRIFIHPQENLKRGVSPVHDVDYYVILLRRIYREIERLAKIDSRVANLKGQHKQLVKKIRIRDHFEHGIGFEELPVSGPLDLPGLKISKGAKISTSLVGRFIVSGNLHWDLETDHDAFVKMANEFLQLHPFREERRKSFVGRIKSFLFNKYKRYFLGK